MKNGRAVYMIAMLVFSATAANAQSATTRIVRAANAFVASLDSAQRRRVLFAFDDEEQRRRWSNFPTGVVARAGVSLRELNPAQRTAALALVSTALSARGYEKVQQIMEADDVFKQTAGAGGRGGAGRGGPPDSGRGRGGPPDSGRGRGGPPGGPPNGGPPGGGRGRGGRGGGGGDLFGRDLYFLSILGTPSERTPWMLQYGGHHLALNITIDGDKGTLTPSLTGAQPSLYVIDGKTVRPLGAESDKALALLNALDASQRTRAILNYQVADLVLGPGEDGKVIQPEGLKVSAMNAKQQTMLLDVIGEWAGIINQSAAATRMAQLRGELDETYFAWSGATTAESGKNITGYYRIQGPHLVIEFAPQRDDPGLHVHTIYRDPTNDYGRARRAQ